MQKVKRLFIVAIFLVLITQSQARDGERRISVEEYVSRMKAGWIGQMVGVGWGAPTEFKSCSAILDTHRVPEWNPDKVNQFRQDDIYVEMTFLRTLEKYGLDVSMRQAGIDFANSRYRLWHANIAGRENLRKGIAPPDSGHPKFNAHPDDIDYQIEADYSGLIAPGLPNISIQLGETFGRLMNYGDGVYAGQFVGGMYAEAFFEKDTIKIIKAGLKCIPAESLYGEMVRDMLKWYKKNPDDWQKTWGWIQKKWFEDRKYHPIVCREESRETRGLSIDAKLNGAYILMGLLYGKGDIDQTTIIAMRCGQDSDCNPSNAAGILFTSLGMPEIPERFTSALKEDVKFSYTEYDFPTLIKVCTKLARQAVKRSGGRFEKDKDGKAVFVIPVLEVKPSELMKSWTPNPPSEPEGARFTEEEMEQFTWVELEKIP